ncbi:MAG: hypothetical protein N838_06580 [Thiohalocapsa sp. PB-PSB1]|nr:MAG: hypothetical protein N838_06580 [Thiohalocapsa sp. PB-PSB1]
MLEDDERGLMALFAFYPSRQQLPAKTRKFLVWTLGRHSSGAVI